jgi:AcrR family transcriptional regulator
MSAARGALSRNPDLSALSLSQLARSVKMSKSNVYRYFETREALLLAVLWEEWGEWFETMKTSLSSRGRGLAIGQSFELRDLVIELSRTLAERKVLCALTAALPSVLERNLSESAIRNFKRQSLRALEEFGTVLHDHCPRLSGKEYARLIYDGACLMAGIFPHAHPSKPVAKVIREPELEFFRHNLSSDLERMMLALALTLVEPRLWGEGIFNSAPAPQKT